MGGVVKIGRKVALECYCCGCKSRPAPDEATAARWAYLGHWDVPGQRPDGEPYEGYCLCPACVKVGRWPLECDGWQRVAGAAVEDDGPRYNFLGDGPVIRLADGDLAADVRLDAMPDALIASVPGPR